MALRILRIAHLRGRPPGLAGGMSGARISHSWSERSLGYRHRDENIKGLQKPAMLLIKPHYLPSRTASSRGLRLLQLFVHMCLTVYEACNIVHRKKAGKIW